MMTSARTVTHNSQNDLSSTSKGLHIQTQKTHKNTKKNTFFLVKI